MNLAGHPDRIALDGPGRSRHGSRRVFQHDAGLLPVGRAAVDPGRHLAQRALDLVKLLAGDLAIDQAMTSQYTHVEADPYRASAEAVERLVDEAES